MFNPFKKIVEKRKAFEAKRKRHYREWQVVQMARKQLLEQDEDEDEDEDNENDEDNEENEENEDMEKDDNSSFLSEEQIDFDVKFKCMPSCESTKKSDMSKDVHKQYYFQLKFRIQLFNRFLFMINLFTII
ncbi:hypothetical protein ANTPLA_LOCUS5540 [Anthophora plagiata]